MYDVSAGLDAYVTLGGNRTLNMINLTAGDRGKLIIYQDATGNRTLQVPASSEIAFGYGADMLLYLSTGALLKDIAYWWYDGTNIFWEGISNDVQ